MTVADAYRRLGSLLSGLEARGVAVGQVTPDESATDEPLEVELRITIPSDPDTPDFRFGESRPMTDGAGAAVSAAGPAAPADDGSPPPAAVAGATDTDTTDSTSERSSSDPSGTESPAEPSDDTAAAHACDRVDCDAGFESEAALTVHRLAGHDRPSEPLHKHEPALRAAYEAYDSFRAMTEALGVDVTLQTVRRSMIDLDIHDTSDGGTDGDEGRADESDNGPTPGEESTAEGATDQQPVTDGSGGTVTESATAEQPSPGEDAEPTAESDPGGEESPDPAVDEGVVDPAAERLPDDLRVADLRTAVVDGESLRTAADRLERSREETREFLDELDLLWLVHGRVATRPDRTEREEAFEAWLEEYREAGEADD